MAKKKSSAEPNKKEKGRQRPKIDVSPVLVSDGSVADPTSVAAKEDPGDETQRRFRYQHAYGVILLLGSASGKLPYKSIWCEHHDDFLARNNGSFDSFQVKTATPEQGPWELTRDGLVNALKKFVALDKRFPGKLASFSFVSNLLPFDTRADALIHKSPVRLLESVTKSNDCSELPDPFGKALSELATRCDVAIDDLFAVLPRVKFVLGPSLADFEAVLSTDHVGQHNDCQQLTLPQIHAIRDELIQKVCGCSSRTVTDPAKHWSCVNGSSDSDPWTKAKEIPVAVVLEIIKAERPLPFRFSPAESLLHKRAENGALTVLEKKLIAGGLVEQLETMRRRTISSERHLLMLAAKDTKKAAEVQNQLESIVKGICDDASVKTKQSSPYGNEMLREVLTHLRQTASENPDLVFSQEYECLVGMAGLLTEACAVWWSPVFDVTEAGQ